MDDAGLSDGDQARDQQLGGDASDGDDRSPGDSLSRDVGYLGDSAGDDATAGDSLQGVDAGTCALTGKTVFVAPGGSDSAAGDLDHPFATVQHALDQTTPGVTVVLRQGVYHELVSVPSSGTTDAPITLRSYCNEVATLDGAGLGGDLGEPALVMITNRSHIVVCGLELRGLTGRSGNFPAGIWVRGASTDIVLCDNDVHQISANNGGRNSGAHGIAVYGTSTTPIERILLDNNHVHDLVLGWSEAVVLNGNVRNFEVRDNVVHDVNNIAFDFIGFEGECAACVDDDVTSGDSIDRVRDGTVAGNLAYNVSSAGNPAYGSEKSAGCFYVDGGAGLVIERNIAHHCDLGLELASEWFGKSTRSIVVRNNFLYKNDVTGIATGGYSSGTGGGGGSTEDCVIVNNTIYDSSLDGWADTGVLLQNRNVNNIYENNIIVATIGHDALRNDGAHNSGNLVDYTIYHRGGASGIAGGANSLSVDPDLEDPANGDLHLKPGSPAVNAGASLTTARAGTVDIDGQARNNGGIDIGADEQW